MIDACANARDPEATPCEGVTLDDLDSSRMTRLIRTARRIRQFQLDEDTPPEDLLRHLNLLNKGRLTNAAMHLFGKAPQRFLISSEIKCAHFHGTQVEKPIPFYQVYKGTGTVDMIRRCAAANLREPEFADGEGFVTTIWRPDYATQLARVQDGSKAEFQAK